MFEQSELKMALAAIKPAIGKRENLPILNCALIAGATVAATCLDMTVSYTLTTADAGPDAVAINHAELTRLVAAGPRGALVHITLDPALNDVAQITVGDISASLPTLPTEDFPHMEAPGPVAGQWTMPAKDLRKLLATCGACVSTEETRYYLQGVYLHAHGGKLAAVATDGHMLAFRGTDLPWTRDDATARGWIMPTNAVKATLAWLNKHQSGEVTLTLHDSTESPARLISIKHSPWSLTTKAIDGTFPNYFSVIPGISKNRQQRCNFDRKAMLDAIKHVGKTMPRVSECVVLDAGAGTVASQPAGVIAAIPYAGGTDIRAGFNWRYLVAVLSGFPCQRIAFSQSGPGKPARFNNPDNRAEVSVVMPMHIWQPVGD